MKNIKSDLDGNKLAEMWNITHPFYMSYFKHVVNSTPDRAFLGVCYKNKRVTSCVLIWPILILFQQPPNQWLLYFVKIRTKYAKKERFFSFNHIFLCFSILPGIYNALKSVNVMLSVNAIYRQGTNLYASMNQSQCKSHLLYISHEGE